MHSLTRKLLTNNLKIVNCCRNLSSNAIKVDEFTLKSTWPPAPVSQVKLLDALWANAHHFKDKVALVSAETNKAYTYDQVQKFSKIFATSILKKLGLQSNDIVAAILPNCPEYPVVVFGSIAAGCIISLINPAYKSFELSHQLDLIKAKVVVTTPKTYNTIARVLKDIQIHTKIVIVDEPNSPVPDGTIRYSELAESGEIDHALLDTVERSQDDVACIPFSSGTTGLPKGVQITFKNLLSGFANVTHEKLRVISSPTDTHQDIMPSILPFFHIYGLVMSLMPSVAMGCKLITISNFHPGVFVDIMKNHKVSIMLTVPPLLMFLANSPSVTQEHLKHLRFIVCGAAPLSSSEVEALLEKSNPHTQFLHGYGATETTCMGSTIYKNSGNRHFGGCGDPLPNIEMRFADPEKGVHVPIGQAGELLIRSPAVMKGYYQNEQATQECMTNDGFYKTGDSAVYKFGEGLYILDRLKELIKVKGHQVAPAQLESLLRTHPSVADVGVIGIPHEFHGQVPKAFVVLKKAKSATDAELKDFVADNVSEFKRIAEVVFVDAIPKNATGKILRKELREM